MRTFEQHPDREQSDRPRLGNNDRDVADEEPATDLAAVLDRSRLEVDQVKVGNRNRRLVQRRKRLIVRPDVEPDAVRRVDRLAANHEGPDEDLRPRVGRVLRVQAVGQ